MTEESLEKTIQKTIISELSESITEANLRQNFEYCQAAKERINEIKNYGLNNYE